MCITFFCVEPSSNKAIKIILGFNREEQTDRKTLRLHQYEDDKNIYAGRDIISGGTWLGINIETGILVFLTNFDIETIRYGFSRGKLVYSFLKSEFVSPENRNQTDSLIESKLQKVAKISQKYSPFNLTIINLRTRKTFYVCSERNQDTNVPIELKKGQTYGICNSDIDTIWPKTAHGLEMFKKLLFRLGQLNEPQMLSQMEAIFKNNQRFSKVDDDESSIFVEPYFCKAEQAERRTKTTLLLLLKELQDNYELLLKETTYNGPEMTGSDVIFRLKIKK